MRFFSFLEETSQLKTIVELIDIARALSKNATLALDFAPHALYDASRETVTVSSFWDRASTNVERHGRKSDVYLRAFGSVWFSSQSDIAAYLRKQTTYPRLALQLFALCEDLRLERICGRLRPGMRTSFTVRREALRSHFAARLPVHAANEQTADVFITAAYLCTEEQGVSLDFHLELDDLAPAVRHAVSLLEQRLLGLFDARHTHDTATLCLEILEVLSPYVSRDAVSDYFSTTAMNGTAEAYPSDVTFDQLVRANAIEHMETVELPDPEDVQRNDMRSDMWHQETKESMDNVIRMNLENGTNTNLLGDKWRESSDEVDSYSEVQGSSQSDAKHAQEDDNQVPVRRTPGSAAQQSIPVSAAAKTRHVAIPNREISPEAVRDYKDMVSFVHPFRQRLKRSVERYLEQKNTARRTDLLMGRLNKTLVRTVTDPTARLFYKKESPLHQIDAVFLLLVDCSGSMYDRLEETKLGVSLFHEVLASVQIPHSVVGFWEDSTNVHDSAVTVLQHFIGFDEWHSKRAGAQITQISAHLDNRDGEAIRLMTKELRRRSERRKFLIVFSDGEPSAAEYEDYGVIDTHQAVLQARREGIEVVNIFFAEDAVQPEGGVRDIYGPWAITMRTVEELPQHFTALLQRLLRKAV